MTTEPHEADPAAKATSAEELFVEHLLAEEAGESVGFEELCKSHPADADTLRALRERWSGVSSIVKRLRDTDQLDLRMRRQYGGAIDPGISLDHDSSTISGGRAEGLLETFQAAGPRDGRYTPRGEIARGGMGAILRVWDKNLRRALAMKVMLKKEVTDEDEGTDPNATRVSRFLEEIQITGQLDHPGIVPVHEMGMDSSGRLYFTMPLIKGRDLKDIFDLVRRGEEGWTQTRALGVLLKVCEAMAFAHSKGVIHRDLKPANIMVGRFGETYVMDWGLAKVLGREETEDMRERGGISSTLSVVHTHRRDEKEHDPESPIVTMDGDVVGTPAYMSPEQAQGRVNEIGPQSDVYSVGTLLYHLVTGQMPYVPLGERVSPHTVLNAVRNGPPWKIRDVEKNVPDELVAICEKAMARSLVERYPDMISMADDLRAFLEGHVVRAYETGAIAEMRKWIVRNKGMAAGLGLSLVLLVGGLFTVIRTNQELETKNAEIALAHEDALAAKGRADKHAAVALEEKARADENSRIADRRGYQSAVAAADASLRLFDAAKALERLDATDSALRGWEWHHLRLGADASVARLGGHEGNVRALKMSPDGERALSVGSDGKIIEWDLEGRKPLRVLPEPDLKKATYIEISADLSRILYGALVFTPGRTGIRLRDLGSKEEAWSLPTAESVTHVTISSDGELVATRSSERVVRLWAARGHEPILTFPEPSGRSVNVMAFDSTGELLAIAEGATVRVYTTKDGKPYASFRHGHSRVGAMVFHPHERTLATGGRDDDAVRLFELSEGSGRSVAAFFGHSDAITSLAFSGNGARLVSGSEDGTVRVWDTLTGQDAGTLLGHQRRIFCLAANFDGSLIVSGPGTELFDEPNDVRLWSLDLAGPFSEFRGHKGAVRDGAWSPDGRRIVSAGDDQVAIVWDSRSGEVQNVLRGQHRRGIRAVAWDPTGRYLATGASDARVCLWDAENGEIRTVLEVGASGVTDIAFSPDGALIAASAADKKVRLFDVQSGELVRTLEGHQRKVHCVAFAPGGERLASGSQDKSVRLFDVATGKQIIKIDTEHRWRVLSVAFDRDGSHLITASADRTARIFKLETGELVATLNPGGAALVSALYAPDGERIVTADLEGRVTIWDAATKEELLSLATADEGVSSAAFDPLGERLLTTKGGGSLRVYETSPPAERFEARVEAAALRRIAQPYVDELFDRHQRMPMVIARLQVDQSLPNRVRQAAMSLARVRGDDPAAFHGLACTTIDSGTAPEDELALAVKRARLACEIDAEDGEREPTYIETLAVALYRQGEVSEAATLLDEVLTLRAKSEAPLSPRGAAVRAMCAVHSGDRSRAERIIAELSAQRDRKAWEESSTAARFLREAQALLETP